jgi:hypothetical protein
VQKFLATETAANAAAERSACNGDDSAMVTSVAATVSSESNSPSNDKDNSDSESSFDSHQYNDFGLPSDNDDKEEYLCFGSPPSLEDMDVFVTEFAPLSEGASSTLPSVSDTSHAPPVQTLYVDDCHEEFPPMSLVGGDMDLTTLEMASLELLTLCDDSGARRGLYNDLLALLRRFRKQKVDITKAKARHLIVRDLEKKVDAPKAKTVVVGGRDVLYFPFLQSLRDLLRSTIFDNAKNLCVNQATEDWFKRFQPSLAKDFGEIMSRSWSTKTQDNMQDFDPDLDFFVGVMLYGDKTGTDVNQCYPLEPWMFTLTTLRRAAREKATSWRHLGFLPLQDYFPF